MVFWQIGRGGVVIELRQFKIGFGKTNFCCSQVRGSFDAQINRGGPRCFLEVQKGRLILFLLEVELRQFVVQLVVVRFVFLFFEHFGKQATYFGIVSFLEDADEVEFRIEFQIVRRISFQRSREVGFCFVVFS